MHKKYGFTLIELLAVIVILAIILAIAIPSITNIIENSQVNALKSNEKMLLKAAKLYVGTNDSALPTNIGDTKEIALSTLQTAGYLATIKDPVDRTTACNGYIIITKVGDTDYDYTPYLNCENNIGSSTDDGLVAHYQFDDFQEPTVNLANGLTISGHGSSWVNTGEKYNGNTKYRNTVTAPNTGNNFGFTTNGISVPLDQNGQKGITISFDNNIVTSPGATIGYVTVQYTDATSTQHSWSYTPSNWYEFQATDYWQRVIGKTNLTSTKTPQNMTIMYVYKDYAPAAQMNVAGIQIEQKKYATPYTSTSRPGVVKDYSGDGRNATLDVTYTPKWIDNTKVGAGAYEFFKGQQTRIQLPDPSLTTKTIAFWVKVKPGDHDSTERVPFIMYNDGLVAAAGDTNQILLGMENNRFRMHGWGASDPLCTSNINDGNWHHLVWQMNYNATDGTQRKMNMWVDGVKEVNNFSYDEGNAFGPVAGRYWWIGYNSHSYSPYIRDAGILMDDVRFYNRLLSNDEVTQLYNSTK